MKFFSVLKAILSGLVWGLGQLFNRQYLKALFFFIFFVGLIGIEILTSSYFEEKDAYDKLLGRDFGNQWVQEGFLPEYQFNKLDGRAAYQPFEDYLESIGGADQLTEDLLIAFLAQDLKDNNPNTYTRLGTTTKILAEDFDQEGLVHINRRQNLFKDDMGRFYIERNITLEDGSNKKEFVETTLLTERLNENNILDSNEGLIPFVKK